jgi:hypothetical protein
MSYIYRQHQKTCNTNMCNSLKLKMESHISIPTVSAITYQ